MSLLEQLHGNDLAIRTGALLTITAELLATGPGGDEETRGRLLEFRKTRNF